MRRPNDIDTAPPGPSRWTAEHLDRIVDRVSAAVTELRAYCDELLAELQRSQRRVVEWQASAQLAWNEHCRLLNAYGEGRDVVHARVVQRIIDGEVPKGLDSMSATEAEEHRRLEAEKAELLRKDPRD